MITLTQLEYIVAVERTGNFRLAAKACFVTQPTLSMQIQKLEDDLGVIIFDRSSQPIQATPIGQKILDQSRVVLSQAALIGELINQEKDRIAGDLRLAVIPTLAPYLLPLFIDAFQKRYPDVRLLIEESKTDDIATALRKNQLDIGLLVTPLADSQLVEHPIFREPFYIYAAKDSPLARLSEVRDEDLQNQDLLLLAEGHCMREQMLRICRHRRAATTSGLQFESGSIETLCHLVEKGYGYTVIPHLSRLWRETSRGRVVPFSDPKPSREVSLVVHRSFARPSLIKALMSSIQASLPRDLRLASQTYETIAIDKVKP